MVNWKNTTLSKMVLSSAPPDRDQRFLQPAVPILLFGAQLASGLRNARNRVLAPHPKASFEPTAGSQGPGSSDASSQGPSLGSNSIGSGSADSWRISLPTPSFTGAFFGIGAGGAAFVSVVWMLALRNAFHVESC